MTRAAEARALLGTAAVLVVLAGLSLFLFPERTDEWFAWTVDPPMTAVFLGASYWASAALETSGARNPDPRRTRLSAWPVLAFTVLTLVVTLVHLDKFHLGAEHPASARVVAWGWLVVYAVVPVLLVVVLVRAGRGPGTGAEAGPAGSLPTALRLLLAGVAVVLGLAGLALLLVPTAGDGWWSWSLTPLTGRAIGAWLVGLGWAAGQAALVDEPGAVRGVGWTGVAFVALQAVALLRHGGDLTWSGAGAAAYLLGLGAVAVAACWILASSSRDTASRFRPDHP